jgi:iron complex transport system ATP-binding protein
VKLEIKNLTFFYDNNFRLEIDDFSIKNNSIISLIGPNGSGKSTLLKIIANILKDYNGEIYQDGKSLKEFTEKEIAMNVSYVNTYLAFKPSIKVIDVVSTGRYVYTRGFGILNRTDFDKIEEDLKIAEIYSKKDHYINQLSSGELKRVLIARGIAQDTPILMLDEPFANLDPKYSVKIMSIVKRLKKEKIIIMATHDINIALLLSDSILALKDGKVFFLFDKCNSFNIDKLSALYEVNLDLLHKVFLAGKFGENPALSRNCEPDERLVNHCRKSDELL